MDLLFISTRTALDDAHELIRSHGDAAEREAGVRAARSRDDGNVQRFCHWRQIERVIALLRAETAEGTIH